ncbi:MAG: putative inositol-monophosphatase [Gammaproteobacteria bacterium]|nr:putative inositol-monophosphatase [Gammaproteobacteria bacterium]
MNSDRLETSDMLHRAKEVLERTAVQLVRSAGEYIGTVRDENLAVQFKPPAAGRAWNSNPVSHVDKAVESLLRARLAATFPDHAVIGEEQGFAPAYATPFTWVIDPVDGTTNFINGLPLFGCSVGVLFHGRPIAGAIWCAATHALAPGVYHASLGGPLRFEGRTLNRRASDMRRGLAAEPGRTPEYCRSWDTRVLGCATLECAFVAAGLLRFASIPRPALWDVAAGLVLLQAANCRALVLRNSRWETLLDFGAGGAGPGAAGAGALALWSEPVLIGDDTALALALAECVS